MPKTRKKKNMAKHNSKLNATTKKMTKESKDAQKKAKRERPLEDLLPPPSFGPNGPSVLDDDGGIWE